MWFSFTRFKCIYVCVSTLSPSLSFSSFFSFESMFTHSDRVLIEMTSKCWFKRMSKRKAYLVINFRKWKKENQCNAMQCEYIKLIGIIMMEARMRQQQTQFQLSIFIVWSIEAFICGFHFVFIFIEFDNEYDATRCTHDILHWNCHNSFVIGSFLGMQLTRINANVSNELIIRLKRTSMFPNNCFRFIVVFFLAIATTIKMATATKDRWNSKKESLNRHDSSGCINTNTWILWR